MPNFRLSRAFGIGRGAKVFFDLRGGVTRGAVPDLQRPEEQTATPNTAAKKQRKAKARKDQQLNEQAEIFRLKKQLKEQAEELFQLRNELKAANGLTGNAQDTPSAPQVPGNSEIGALPDFVIIGAMRCGTSQFYSLLTRHPDIQRAAAKEVHYFDRPERFEKGVEWYRRCFPSPRWTDGRRSITGEATPRYLADPLVPERMVQVVPEARLIVLLRNPVDRAYSHYHLAVRRGHETRSFEEVVEEEQAWLSAKESGASGYVSPPVSSQGHSPDPLARGIYVDQIQRWRRFYDEEQMLILRSEDFFKRSTDTMKLVQDFLGLPYRKLDLPPRKTSRRTDYQYDPMNPATRQRLEAFFEPHNQRLYEYLGADFKW